MKARIFIAIIILFQPFSLVDIGIRNAVVNQFNPLSLRNDTGALWENLMIVERYKYNEYHRLFKNTYFWRTTRQQEIDYIEEYDGNIFAYEFKWHNTKKTRIPLAFTTAYPDVQYKVIDKNAFLEFVT